MGIIGPTLSNTAIAAHPGGVREDHLSQCGGAGEQVGAPAAVDLHAALDARLLGLATCLPVTAHRRAPCMRSRIACS